MSAGREFHVCLNQNCAAAAIGCIQPTKIQPYMADGRQVSSLNEDY